MTLITNAERALVRNWRAIFLYILLCVAVVALYRFASNEFDRLLTGGALLTPDQLAEIKPKPAWYIASHLVADIALACLISLLQACAYARLGADIDRPLWKCLSDREAIARYAVIWIMLNLFYFTLMQLQSSMFDQGQVAMATLLSFFALAWNLIYVPIGVCLMHHGGLKELRLAEALMPMLHFLPRTLLVAGLGFLQLILFELILSSVPEAMRGLPWIIAPVNIPIIYLECLGVAIMWSTCAEYRAVAAAHQDDDDFDF
ncbi:MAG: hypothetical protein JNK74_13420 [Candidatus Hydrogenedentes bacterium]|nr:hypothetical protein [Candidatus Hydrogenedentota bacterium]